MDISIEITRILLAAALGALVGLEREFTQKSAGLRTHILVTMGATLFTLVSLSDFYHGLFRIPMDVLPGNGSYDVTITRDPSRVAAQVVAGIGFIGGGAVLRYGTTVKGLTTAASLWIMASIGMLVGIGQYRLSIIATLVAFLVLFTIGKIERYFFTKSIRPFNRLKISVTAKALELSAPQNWLESRYRNDVLEVKTKVDASGEKVEMTYTVNISARKVDVNDISKELCRLKGVVSSSVKPYHENEEMA